MENNQNIRKLLIKIGISSNLQGFQYILDSIEIINERKIISTISLYKELVEIDKQKGITSTIVNVERAMRYAVTKAYKSDLLKKIYSKKPDNSAFIHDLVYNIDIFMNELEEK